MSLNRMAASKSEAPNRLQRHLPGKLRGADQIPEVMRLFERPVLGQVAPDLAHDPHGRPLGVGATGSIEKQAHGAGVRTP